MWPSSWTQWLHYWLAVDPVAASSPPTAATSPPTPSSDRRGVFPGSSGGGLNLGVVPSGSADPALGGGEACPGCSSSLHPSPSWLVSAEGGCLSGSRHTSGRGAEAAGDNWDAEDDAGERQAPPGGGLGSAACGGSPPPTTSTSPPSPSPPGAVGGFPPRSLSPGGVLSGTGDCSGVLSMAGLKEDAALGPPLVGMTRPTPTSLDRGRFCEGSSTSSLQSPARRGKVSADRGLETHTTPPPPAGHPYPEPSL